MPFSCPCSLIPVSQKLFLRYHGEDCLSSLSSSAASFLCIFDSWNTTSPSRLPVPRHLMTFPSYWWLPSQSHFCEIFSTSILFLESRFHNCSDFHLINLMKYSKKQKNKKGLYFLGKLDVKNIYSVLSCWKSMQCSK